MAANLEGLMSWDGITKFVQSPLSIRVATNIVLAGALAGGGLLAQNPYVNVRHVLTQTQAPTLLITLYCVLCFGAASLITGLFVGGVGKANQFREGRKAARAAAAHAAEQARLASVNAAEQARLQAAAHERTVGRLRSILPDLPSTYRDVLARFHAANGRNVALKREDSPSRNTVTYTLLQSGFIHRSSRIDHETALYQLQPVAVAVVRDYFDALHAREAAEKRARLEAAIRDADDNVKALLRLFGEPNPVDRAQPAHAWMERPVYEAVDGLVQAGVLERDVDPRPIQARVRHPWTTERITLTPEGRELVETSILNRPVERTSIVLDYKHIAGSGGSGSGAARSVAYSPPHLRPTSG
jgi:hypothetical protein